MSLIKNNLDRLSLTQVGNQRRHVTEEIRELRNDIRAIERDKREKEIDMRGEADSPYLADRLKVNIVPLKSSAAERNWKDVPTVEDVKEQAIREYNLKRLNII
jgi:hypothetical protein